MTEKNEKTDNRISDDVRELVVLVREWAEVGLERSKAEVEFRINQMLRQFIAAVLAIFILFFVLLTMALGIGVWLGDPFWGYLVVTAILLCGVLVLRFVRPRFWTFESEERASKKSVELGSSGSDPDGGSVSALKPKNEDKND